MAHSKTRLYGYSVCILAAALLNISLVHSTTALFAPGDEPLDIYNDSLTTYLPTTVTTVQKVFPLAEQRGVNIDGSLRVGSAVPMSMAANPFGESWNSTQMLSSIRLDTGTHVINDVDLALPSVGAPWVIGRSYNARQHDGTNYVNSNGAQGKNWSQLSQPEIMLYDHPTDAAKDVLYLVYGADRYIEFKRVDADSTEFKSKNGAAGIIEFIVGDPDNDIPDTYKYTDQRGWQFYFFGFDFDSLTAKGQFWKFVIPKPGGSHVAYVGATDAIFAVGSYDANGNIKDVRDTSGRYYTYAYDGNDRLISVTVKDPDNTYEIARINYSYHDGGDAHGTAGDLKLVTISTPLTEDTSGYDEDKWLIKDKYYRYWKGTWSAGSPGHKHLIKYIVDFEGTRNFDWSELGIGEPELDDGFLTASDNDLKAYAAAYFEYEDEDEGNNKHKRITEAWFNGECGCSGASSGTYKFTYHENDDFPATPSAGYDEEWFTRTVVEQPQITNKTADGAVESYITQYFDEVGQPLSRVLTDDDPAAASDLWATHVLRDVTNGWIDTIHSPANVTGYTHNEIGGDPDGAITTSTSIGLVTEFLRASSGDLVGFLEVVKHRKGTSGDAYLDLTLTHTTRTLETGDADVVRPLIASQRIYTTEITSGTTDSRLTSIDYTWHEISTKTDVLYITPETIKTTYPLVTTANNGSNTATTSNIFLNETGQTEWSKSTDGKINYWLYIDESGRLDKSIQDADTTHTDFTDPDPDITIPSGFDSDGNGELHIVSCFGYVGGGGMGSPDGGCSSGAGGDSITTGTGPTRVTYRARLKDGRVIQLSFPHYVDVASDEYYGPVGCIVINLAGKVKSQGTIALDTNSGEFTTEVTTDFVDETKYDIIAAIEHAGNSIGTVDQLSTQVYNETGQSVSESRLYFKSSFTFPGSEGTDFDATFLGYNDQGRSVRVLDATGQIQRTVFDSLGRTTQQWTGTNDNAFDGGSSPGPDNMVKIVELVYDSAGDEANSYLTKQTQFVENSTTDKRETTFEHDLRGRVLLTTNPAAPHVLAMYDNLGRQLATGLYSSTASIVVGTDIPTTETTNRLALSQTSYDERGQVWQSKSHKIDSADGSDDDNILTQNWFNKDGQLIKVDGSQLMKIGYNRLGQRTHTYILANDNDTTYAHADDVAGDIVLQESQTVIDVLSGITLMTATIDRDHDDYGVGETTGALDDNNDGGTPDPEKYTAVDINGQIQITAYWYDKINRLSTVANYGNNGGSDFTRPAPPISHTDIVLVTDYTYNADGTLLELNDPMDLKTRYTYDAAARQTVVTNNYVNGTPSGLNGDDDVVTRYVYDNGQRTKLWVDIYPVDLSDQTPDAEDQVTTYTYGVLTTDSPVASKFTSNRLLREIKYPDSASATDVVTFSYNAQGQQIWVEDQEHIEITTDYDDLGRETDRNVTEIDITEFNDDVLKISTVYDSLGRVSTVTQYDAVTSGTITDQVQYTYDGWSNIANFEQDNDSAVGTATVNDYEVRYTYEKATTGRNTIRRINMKHYYDATLKKTVVYNYSSSGNLHDDDVSRVTDIRSVVGLNITIVAAYDYLGVGQVVGTDYPEPDVFSNLYTSGGYTDNLDNFRRVTSNIWYKDLSTDREIYDVDPTYNRNSNITYVVDNINVDASSVGIYDAAYTLDNLNRLTNAQWGDWSGTSFTNEQREKIWTLTQTGNWDIVQLDLNNDDVYTGTGEYDDDRTHNVVNELTGRDTDDNGTNDHDLLYDDLGELTDDDENYIYKYDAFGRLIEVSTTGGSPALVSEYRYNGLGHRIAWHYDVDADGTVENSSDDPEYFFAYNEAWQRVATYRAADTSPKEQFVYHNAGLGGYGGSSAIDGVILRDKDTNTAWGTESDGTLEDRIYYCQNWRGDVSVIVTDLGKMVEWVKYTAYGIPFGMPLGDTDSDGDLDSTDVVAIYNWSAPYDVRFDPNLDGVIDSNDVSMAGTAQPITLGFGALSDVLNRKGYAGYEHAPELANSMWHVRNRVMISELLGRWITRDPIGYRGGVNLYQYVNSNPVRNIDPFGLIYFPPGIGDRIGRLLRGFFGRRPVPDPIYPPSYFAGPLVQGCIGRRPAPAQPVAAPGSGGGFAFIIPIELQAAPKAAPKPAINPGGLLRFLKGPVVSRCGVPGVLLGGGLIIIAEIEYIYTVELETEVILEAARRPIPRPRLRPPPDAPDDPGKCNEHHTDCMMNPWQPDWNREQFGPEKDCLSCLRECRRNGKWPIYKCPPSWLHDPF